MRLWLLGYGPRGARLPYALVALIVSGCPALVPDRYTTDAAPPAGSGGDSAAQGGAGSANTGGLSGAGSGLGASGGSVARGGAGTGGAEIGGSGGDGGTAGDRGGAGAAGSEPEGGGAGSAGVSGAGGSGGVALAPPGFGYRRDITIEAGSTEVPAGYTLCVPIDHAALVASGRALSGGDDLRVFRRTAGAFEELDRVPAPDRRWSEADTEVCFATSVPIPANATDESYAIYYGSATGGEPPEDGRRVFLVYDDFADGVLDSGWTLGRVGTAQGNVEEVDGTVVVTGTTGNIFEAADDFLFLERPANGGVRLETCVAAAGGSQSMIAKLGGVMVRQSLARGSVHRMISPVEGADFARVSHYRLTSGALTLQFVSSGPNPVPECYALTRLGNAVRTFYKKEEAPAWIELGSETRFMSPLSDPVLIGIPVANDTSMSGWVSSYWFVASRYVEPEPTASLGAEVPLP